MSVFFVPRARILVDSREQQPWRLPRSKIVKLRYGDVTLEGKEDLICIERKGSVHDFYKSIGKNRARFLRMMWNMTEDVKYCYLILEFSLADLYYKPEYSQMDINGVIGTLIAIMNKGIRVIFVGKRPKRRNLCRTERFVLHLLAKGEHG